MATEHIRVEEVPAITIIRARVSQFSEEISVEEAGQDFDSGDYFIRLGSGDRDTVVRLSRELLDDIRDNPTAPTSKYSQALNDRLTVALSRPSSTTDSCLTAS